MRLQARRIHDIARVVSLAIGGLERSGVQPYAKWTGTLQARTLGDYEFCAYGDDVLDVYLDDKLVVRDENDPPGVSCAMFRLEAGARYAFRAELFDNANIADASVWWRGPGFDAQHVLDTLPMGAQSRPERCDGKKQNCSATKADADAIDDSDGQCDCSLLCRRPY